MRARNTGLFLLTALFAVPACAGEITGRILNSDGSSCSTCRVSAYIKWGGMTDKVSTDSKGRFTLTWSSDNSVGELYVDGKKEAENISSGQYVEIHLD